MLYKYNYITYRCCVRIFMYTCRCCKSILGGSRSGCSRRSSWRAFCSRPCVPWILLENFRHKLLKTINVIVKCLAYFYCLVHYTFCARRDGYNTCSGCINILGSSSSACSKRCSWCLLLVAPPSPYRGTSLTVGSYRMPMSVDKGWYRDTSHIKKRSPPRVTMGSKAGPTVGSYGGGGVINEVPL